jgi:AcrR family transcriptional regulator
MTSDIVKRPYHSPLRRAQAEATRSKVLDGALHLFAQQGYAATTIAEIAREAGVVPETIYSIFRTKRAIVDGLIADAAPPEIVASMQDGWATKAGDPAAQLAFLARFSTAFWSRNDTLAAVFRQGTGDAEIGEEWSMRQLARRAGFAAAIAGWPASVLRPKLSHERAADVIWALASEELFHLLVRERRWSVPRFRQWLTNALQRDLLADPPGVG